MVSIDRATWDSQMHAPNQAKQHPHLMLCFLCFGGVWEKGSIDAKPNENYRGCAGLEISELRNTLTLRI